MSNTDGDEIKPPKVTGSPERIWLCYGDLERDDTHDDCYLHGEVTWCKNKQGASDVEYVRADALTAQATTIAEQAGEIKALRAENEAIRELMDAYNLGGWTDSLRLIQERDALRADAELYRCLRDRVKGWYIGPEYSTYNDKIVDGEYVNYSGQALDTAINAVLQASETGGKAVQG